MRCPDCRSLDIDLVEVLPDSRRELVCLECATQWVHGQAAPVTVEKNTVTRLRTRFPTAATVPEDRRERVEAFKTVFLDEHPTGDPQVPEYWQRYQQVFSREGLQTCDPQDLKDFANSAVGAHPGMMAGFNVE